MSQQPGLGDFTRHAKRGFFWRALGVYILGSWIALQVVDVLVSSFGLPEWFPGFALALLVIGLPIVLATAIVQQGLAGGVPGGGADGGPAPDASAAGPTDTDGPDTHELARGTGIIDRPTTRPPRLYRMLTWRNAVTGGVLAFALWGVLAAAWLGLTTWVRGANDTGTASFASADDLRAIAVLPFDNLSADADNAYFADGIHEDVLTQLSKIAELTVISRTSVMPYRESRLSLVEIAGELGVGSVLEGSVRRAGNNVRITAQLIDARTDEHLWADNFDRALTTANVFAIQSEIAQRIADALAARLSPREESRIIRVPTEDLAAYDRYLRGRDVYQTYTRDGIERSIDLFKEALEIDQAYAEAYAGLADAYSQRVQIGGFGLEWADSAQSQAQRAIDLNPEGASGYKALGLAYSMQGQSANALEANLAAVERDPNHHGAVNNVGVQESLFGRFDEALRWYKRGARLNPTTFGPANVSFTYARLGESEIARAYFDANVDIPENTPILKAFFAFGIEVLSGDADAGARVIDGWRGQIDDDPFFFVYDAQARHLTGDFQGSRTAAERASSMAPGAALRSFNQLETILGYALIRTGEAERGRAMLAQSQSALEGRIARGADNPGFSWELGMIQSALGNTEEAIRLLAQAREGGLQPARGPAVFEPMLDPVRGDARFQALMESSARELEQMRLAIEAEEIANGER